MKHNPTNINYTAADIKQYLEGKMSPQQMNALEKAALEDPFLQEAIEGYEAVAAEEWQPVLQGLQQSFAAPAGTTANNTAKVVGFGRKKWGWIKYAAAVLIVGGGFTTIYIINQSQTNGVETPTVAAVEKEKAPVLNNAVAPQADSINALANNKSATDNNTFANTTRATDTTKPGTPSFRDELKKEDSLRYAINDVNPAEAKETKFMEISPQAAEKIEAKPSPILPVSPAIQPASKAPVKPAPTAPLAGYTLNEYDVAKKKDMATATMEREGIRSKSAGRNQNARFFNQQTINTNQGLLGNNAPSEVNRSFVAQVVDDKNNPLPFANINVKNEGFGTYADAKGNVRLVSTDSVILIEVKSLGFQTQTILLRSTEQPATIRLREDNNIAYQEKTVDRKQATSNVMSRRAFLQRDVEQNAEPADGWEKYDTYISNNLVIPDDLVKKNVHGEVALSFDVQKNGAITNIKVDKSLCNDCDEIAKRIVAQGPQWKVKKGKKAKARVTVQF